MLSGRLKDGVIISCLRHTAVAKTPNEGNAHLAVWQLMYVHEPAQSYGIFQTEYLLFGRRRCLRQAPSMLSWSGKQALVIQGYKVLSH